MRIGFDAHTALAAQSGPGHYALDLVEELVRQAGDGDQVVLFHTGPEPTAELAWLLRNDRLTSVNVSTKDRRSAQRWGPLSLGPVERLLTDSDDHGGLDLLHALRPPFLPSRARSRVLTVRTLPEPPDTKLAPAFRRSLLHANAVVVTSDGLRQELMNRFAAAQPKRAGALEQRLQVVPPGVHSRFLSTPRSVTLVGLCDAYPFLGEPYLLAPGGLADPERSLPLLVGACRLARERDESLPPLVLLGREADTAMAAPILDGAQAGGRVYWLQDLESELLPALYRGAELLLYPGLDHAFGQPVLEAAAMGVPSVVGAPCGAAELLLGGVEIVNEVDAEAWAAAILRLHRDETARREVAERAGELAREHTWDRVARRHWELYRALAA